MVTLSEESHCYNWSEVDDTFRPDGISLGGLSTSSVQVVVGYRSCGQSMDDNGPSTDGRASVISRNPGKDSGKFLHEGNLYLRVRTSLAPPTTRRGSGREVGKETVSGTIVVAGRTPEPTTKGVLLTGFSSVVYERGIRVGVLCPVVVSSTSVLKYFLTSCSFPSNSSGSEIPDRVCSYQKEDG